MSVYLCLFFSFIGRYGLPCFCGVCMYSPTCVMLVRGIIFGVGRLPCHSLGHLTSWSLFCPVFRGLSVCRHCVSMFVAVKWVSISHDVITDITLSRKMQKCKFSFKRSHSSGLCGVLTNWVCFFPCHIRSQQFVYLVCSLFTVDLVIYAISVIS